MLDASNLYHNFDSVFDYIENALILKNVMTEELSSIFDEIYCDYVNLFYKGVKENEKKKFIRAE